MKQLLSIFIFLFFFLSCQSQDQKDRSVGGNCEGCEAIYEYGDKILRSTDTLPDFEETEPKLRVEGIVYQNDGITPASDVIIYIYHTDREGIYPKEGDEKGWARRHGYIQGWVKTGKDGSYTFLTFRPASYPKTTIPEHIHIIIKEPGVQEYYIDDFMFDDDLNLSAIDRNNRRNRGGSGIVKPQLVDNTLVVERDIVLGLNVPGY